MSEMVERVARALAAQYAKECDLGADYEDGAWETYIEGARAAIEAMREPTEAMVEEGGYQIPGERSNPRGAWAVWSEMIDAALK